MPFQIGRFWNIAFALLFSVTAVSAAEYLEHVEGYKPCMLCYEGRIPHYLGIPLLMGALELYRKGLHIHFTAAPAALFYLYGVGLSIYHAGAEWKFWEGPTSCGAINLKAGVSAADLLQAIQSTPVVSCTEPALRFMGLSLAGMNGLVCGLIVALLVSAMLLKRHPSAF